VKEAIVNEGTFTLALLDVLPGDELLPHAARTRPTVAASEIVKLFLVTSCKSTTSSIGKAAAKAMG
jgi:hypothetical protein